MEIRCDAVIPFPRPLVYATYRDKLIELYGEEKGSKIEFAEAFEISEYGYMPREEQLKKLFPFF